ncbi:hypothetical protein J1N35_022053 [Gossypium stocksii]|uniref:RNase H type-1 domain-containing protein n=1 Tax=Gossypium stocksii TaxID=47602 RepID=A0A9D3VGW1_9ROSI|nr:hypothetical protein J1N35_022053 [Gossypium stocksii]
MISSRMIMNDNIFLASAAGALACFQAVQMDLALGFLEVEIEGDALTVVKKLHAIREDRYEISAYIRNSISLSESYQSCFFGHAPKQGIRVAHLLAIEGIKRGVSTYLTQGVPLSAAIAVEKDWWWMDLPDRSCRSPVIYRQSLKFVHLKGTIVVHIGLSLFSFRMV